MCDKKLFRIVDYNDDCDNTLFIDSVNSFLLSYLNISVSDENMAIFCSAFTTSGFSNDSNYERLEFYGDAVIKEIICKNLFNNKLKMTEGEMTVISEHLYSNNTYPECLFKEKIDILRRIRFDKSTLRQKLENRNNSIFNAISDCFEALIGALAITNNYNTAEVLVNKIIKTELDYCLEYRKNNHIESKVFEEREKVLKKTFIDRLNDDL